MLKDSIFLINVTLNIDHSKAEAKRLRLLGVEKVDKTVCSKKNDLLDIQFSLA